ncbi:cytochrome P450 [Rhizophagus irregularis DAOM 181602=DAOM 197198]|nr:cytochrome P450 [Rhizophagus irregularis DAOM 181602=DAOM 197198]
MQEAICTGTYKTGNLLSFIVYYIEHNPDVKNKLLKEIDSIFQADTLFAINVKAIHTDNDDWEEPNKFNP